MHGAILQLGKKRPRHRPRQEQVTRCALSGVWFYNSAGRVVHGMQIRGRLFIDKEPETKSRETGASSGEVWSSMECWLVLAKGGEEGGYSVEETSLNQNRDATLILFHIVCNVSFADLRGVPENVEPGLYLS